MGKHVKKRNDAAPPKSAVQKARRDPYDDWLDAAAREGEYEDLFAVDEPEEPAGEDSPAEIEVPAEPEPPLETEETVDPALPAEPAEEPKPAPRPRRAAPPQKNAAPERKKKAASPNGRNPKKKKKGRFRRNLRIYVIVMLALIVAILAALWVFLSRWQAKKDAEAAEEARIKAELAEQRAHEAAVRRAPQDAFDAWLAGTDADTWTDLWFEDHSDALESREMIRGYMEEHFSAAEPFRAADYTPEAPVYVLRDGDLSLAKVSLFGSDVTWSVADAQLLLEGKEGASVRAFTGGAVFCNGVELGPEYAGEVETTFDFEPLADKLVNPVGWQTYSVSGLLMPPTLTAEPPEGSSVTQTESGDFLLCLDENAGKTFVDRSVGFMRAYQYYYMSGLLNTWGNLYAALAYLVPGTPAYQTLFDTKIGVEWNTAYGDIDTSNTTAGSVVIWADNCYSVDVTYAPTGLLNGQRVNYDGAGTMRIYFLRGNDGGFYISHFQPIY